MTKIEIDKGPVAPPAVPLVVYPWDEMKIGDSFLLQCTFREQGKVRSRVVYAARCKGFRIQTRSEPEGVRVWLAEIIKE